MTDLFVYQLQTEDDRNTVVVSPTSKEARTHAQIYDPTGGWEKARLKCLGPTWPKMSLGVVSLERRIPDGT